MNDASIVFPEVGRRKSTQHANAQGRGETGASFDDERMDDYERMAQLIHCDAVMGVRFELSRLWTELISGRWIVRETFTSTARHYAVVEGVPAEHARALDARSLAVLERLLLGERQKVIAIDLRLSASTVTTSVQTALRALGLRCRGCRPPLLLAMAVHSANADGTSEHGRITSLPAGPNENLCWIVSARRADLEFPASLSAAERAVTRALAAGQTHAEICSARARSPRTVANQIAAAFRKLGVSGRGELLNRLVLHWLRTEASNGSSQPPPSSGAESLASRLLEPDARVPPSSSVVKSPRSDNSGDFLKLAAGA